MESGTSTFEPDAVTVPTVTTSEAAKRGKLKKKARTAMTARILAGVFRGSSGSSGQSHAQGRQGQGRYKERERPLRKGRNGSSRDQNRAVDELQSAVRDGLDGGGRAAFVGELREYRIDGERDVRTRRGAGRDRHEQVRDLVAGSAALEVKGMRFVASSKLPSSEIEPGAAGLLSKVGVSGAVMPARVNEIDCTATAGE